MNAQLKSWILRRSRILYPLYLLVAVFVSMEVAMRIFIRADLSYYVAFSDPAPGSEVQYPYGIIRYNRDGFADDEFDAVKTRPRVGYCGDSLCFGVGAGYGYRISEIMAEYYDQFEHMNLTGGLENNTLELNERVLEWDDRYDLDMLVYLMTLDDIKPTGVRRSTERFQTLRSMLDWLRGRSYVYTYLRQVFKTALIRSERLDFEMFPTDHADAFEDTARRINEMAQALAEREVHLVIVVMPYEMQVSRDAERAYAAAGAKWEGEFFIDRGPQELLMEKLDAPVVVDAYWAFVEPGQVERDRDRFEVGECFVYNRGDKLDWAHPNRKGHRIIADYMARQNALRLPEKAPPASGD